FYASNALSRNTLESIGEARHLPVRARSITMTGMGACRGAIALLAPFEVNPAVHSQGQEWRNKAIAPYELRAGGLRVSQAVKYRGTSGFGLRGHALVLEEGLQLAGLEHLAHDVAAAHKLALDVELRNGRPVGIGLDADSQVVGVEHIEALVG